MPTQNVNLTPELDLFVKEEIATGHFNNASEVHRAALSAMAREKEERGMRLQLLRAEIQKGLNDADSDRMTVTNGQADLDSMLDASLEVAISRLEAGNAEVLE